MRRRIEPSAGRLFLGKRYETEAEYHRARQAWQARRHRLLALVRPSDA
ncbi:hypothetical protein [Mycolicibacterium sphagni]|nr:hypothetical protein [Mycolicibacterium sphagni]